METGLLVAVAALFVAVLVLKSLIGLAARYLLFVAVAVLVFRERLGWTGADLLDADRAMTVAMVALGALFGTKLIAFALFKQSRWRYLLTPVTGVVLTAGIVRVLAA